MKYQEYKIEELLKDKTFHNWVNGSSQVDSDYWNSYLMANPGQEEKLKVAARIIKGIPVIERRRLSLNKIEVYWEDLNRRIKNKETLKIISNRKNWKRLSVAAGLLAILLIATFFIAINSNNSISYTTVEGESKTFVMSETQVVLYPNSKITYIEAGTDIQLKGNADFSISSKNNKQLNFNNTFDLFVEGVSADFQVSYNENYTRILVNSGEIKLSYTGKKETLNIGAEEEAILEDGKQNFVKKNFKLKINSA